MPMRWIFSLVVLDVLVHADHDGPQLGQLQRHLPPDAVTRPRDQDHLPCNVTSRVTVTCHVETIPATSRNGRGLKLL